MKAYLADRLIIEGPLPQTCTGFVCDRMEVDAGDVLRLTYLQVNQPDALRRCLLQLSARFMANRVPMDGLQ
jgi:hypothetical protein